MNTPIICLSLKYINIEYENISNICKWIYYELVKCNYTDHKLLRSLYIEDYEIIKSIIKFNRDEDVLSNNLIYFCKCNKLKLVTLLIDNGADIHASNNEALRWASHYGCFDIAKLLIDNGADGPSGKALGLSKESPFIHANNNEALKHAKINGRIDVVKLLIDNGAKMN